jgi:hypothetical protein
LKVISQFIVKVMNLLEAEGRTLLGAVQGEGRKLRGVVRDLLVGVAFLVVSIPLLTAGTLLVAAGAMWWLEAHVGRPAAAVISGLLLLAVGGVCVLVFRAFTRGPRT